MSLDSPVLSALNGVLARTLTAINQYFLHARILKHRGMVQLADHAYRKSIDEMKHSDMLIERILALGGLPQMHALQPLSIGASASEILASDLAFGTALQAELTSAMELCERADDVTSAAMLRTMKTNSQEYETLLSSHRMTG